MFVFWLHLRRTPLRFHLCALGLLPAALGLLLTLAAGRAAAGQGTHLWTQSHLEEFEKGTPQGVALTSDGHLREGPGLTELATTPSTYVWSVAVDRNGVVYAGTGAPAAVLRVGQDGKPFTLFESKELSVEVVRLGPDRALYAGTVPSGRVYRLKADAEVKQDEASATVVFDPARVEEAKDDAAKGEAKPHYVWELAFDAAGRLYVASGGPAAIYRVGLDKTGAKAGEKPERFFTCDEQHIRSLAWDGKGNLIAGTDGSGLVYRISPEGKGYVLFEAPRREITAVAVGVNGAGKETIYAASVGDKSRNPLPPLPVQGVGSATLTILQPGSLQAANTSAALPEGTEIYALSEGQAPRKLWWDKEEIVYALGAGAEGLVTLTGNRGRVFRIADDGSYSDIAHLDAQQGLSLAVWPGAKGQPGALYAGSGNTGKVFRLGANADRRQYASDVLDAGALARFGRVEVEPGSQGYALWTRTGNVEQPARGRSEWGWSEWQPVSDGAVASPAGRYLQWKAELGAGGELGGVGVNYLPVNAAPVVDELVVVTGARLLPQVQPAGQPPTVSIALPSASQGAGAAFDAGPAAPLQASKDRTAITVRWAAHDDNGDDLTFSLYLRGDRETVWRLLKDGVTDKAYSFDATLIPDGGYQLKVVASDAPSHSPGEALSGEKISERFEVDTTPPVVSSLKAAEESAACKIGPCPKDVKVSFDAEDGFSPIAHAEYSLDAGPWQTIEPAGGLSDSRREHYEVRIAFDAAAEKTAEHLITVRVYDRHDNAGLAKTVIAAQRKDE